MPSKSSTAKGHCLIFNKSSIRLSTLEGQVSHFYFWPSDTRNSGDLRLWTGRICPKPYWRVPWTTQERDCQFSLWPMAHQALCFCLSSDLISGPLSLWASPLNSPVHHTLVSLWTALLAEHGTQFLGWLWSFCPCAVCGGVALTPSLGPLGLHSIVKQRLIRCSKSPEAVTWPRGPLPRSHWVARAWSSGFVLKVRAQAAPVNRHLGEEEAASEGGV